ncbi:MAG: S8 family serine peptidase [archaeon]
MKIKNLMFLVILLVLLPNVSAEIDCSAVNFCSDYTNQDSCSDDVCSVAEQTLEFYGNDCSSSGIDCMCSWEQSLCNAKFTRQTEENAVGNNQNQQVFESNGNLSQNLINRALVEKGFYSNASLGYIVELKEEPLAVRTAESVSASVGAGRGVVGDFVVNVANVVLPKRLEIATPGNIEDKFQIHKNKIQNEHENFRQNALQKISSITGSAVANENELNVLSEYENVLNGFALNITAEEAELLKELDEVKGVYPNYFIELQLSESVPMIFADEVWTFDLNRNDCATSGENCITGKGITIGIIDTGIDYTHDSFGACDFEEVLDGDCEKIVNSWDFVDNNNDPLDFIGHGTHLAAIAAGNGVLKGVAPDAKIVAYKVLGAPDSVLPGSGDVNAILSVFLNQLSYSYVLNAIERSVDPNQDGNLEDHLDVLLVTVQVPCSQIFGTENYVIGGQDISELCGADDPLSRAVDNAVDAGVVVVASAGNYGPETKTIGSPGTARKAITVGTSNRDDEIPQSSSRGPVGYTSIRFELVWEGYRFVLKPIIEFLYLSKPDIVAPGENICSARSYINLIEILIDVFYQQSILCQGDEHIYLSGSSTAAAHVAGAAALMKQAHPSLSPVEIKIKIKEDAIHLLNYDSDTQGSGRLSLADLIEGEQPGVFPPGEQPGVGLTPSPDDSIESGYRIEAGQSIDINAHGVCKKIINNGNQVHFIPTKTQIGWNSFIRNPPAEIIFSVCEAPAYDAPVTGSVVNGFPNIKEFFKRLFTKIYLFSEF